MSRCFLSRSTMRACAPDRPVVALNITSDSSPQSSSASLRYFDQAGRRGSWRRAGCRGCEGYGCSFPPCTGHFELGQVEVHLGRRLGVGRQLEDERHPVDRHLLARLVITSVGGIRVTVPVETVTPRPAGHLPLGPRRQEDAVHVAGPAAHGVAGHDVFAHRGLEEALRGDDPDLAGLHVLLGDHALHAAIVVDVAVGIDHRHHRLPGPVLIVEVQGGPGDSAEISGSTTMMPVSPSMKVMLETSEPRTW